MPLSVAVDDVTNVAAVVVAVGAATDSVKVKSVLYAPATIEFSIAPENSTAVVSAISIRVSTIA